MKNDATYEEINHLLHEVCETDERLAMKCCAALDGDMRAWDECARVVSSRRPTERRIVPAARVTS